MRHPWTVLPLAACALALTVSCNSGTKGGPANPGDPGPGLGGPVTPPDFGPAPPGQNDPLRVVARMVENDKKAPFTAGFFAEISGGTGDNFITWDFDGDGIVDAYGENVATTFASAGDYQTEVTVRDSANTVARSTIEVHVLPPGPDLKILANGQEGLVTGRAPLTVSFNTSGSTGVIRLWEWDFNGDGTIDYTSTITGNVNVPQGALRPYDNPGTYTPILRATNDEGFVEEASILVVATF